MNALADAQGALSRLLQRLAEAAPVAWRHDPLFRGASIGAGVTLALLLLRLVGPHDPDLDAPTIHYDPATRSTWVGPRSETVRPQSPASPSGDVPKIAPGQPLNSVTPVPVPNSDHFGTFNPGKHP